MKFPLFPQSSQSEKTVRISLFRVVSLLVLALCVAATLPRFSSATQSAQENAAVDKGRKLHAIPGEILVRFRKASSTAKAYQTQKLAVEGGRQIDLRIEKLSAVEIVEGLRLAQVAPEETANALEALRARADVIYAEPNLVRRALKSPNDPRYPQMWGLKNTGQASTSGGNPGKPGNDVQAEAAWELTTGSKSVVVGVVDEGIDVNHEDLRDNMWTNPGETPGNGVDDDANGFVDDVNGWDFAHNDSTVFDYPGATYPPADTYAGDVDDHGTHVAGTIGAKGNNGIGVVGVNWDVSLMSLKFLTGVDGFGTTADLLKALSYAKAMRALWISSGGLKGANIRVLNNSYGGGGYSQAEFEGIRALSDAGILFVVAAGNESSSNDRFPSYPANYFLPNIISVAASSGGGTAASFSNFGQGTVNMTAPGQYILSTTPKNTYDFFSGTSMSTPHVAGSAALVCAAFPDISMDKLRSLLLYSGYVATWQYQYVYPISTGRSMDANAALQGVTSADTTAPAAVTNFRFESGPLFPILNLRWGSPGDDGTSGKVAAYEIRFSESNLNDPAAFDLATPLPGPVPESAGMGQDLSFQYPWRHPAGFVGIRAVDEVGNKGPITSLPVPVPAGAGDPYIVTQSAPTPLSTGGTPLGLNVDDGHKQIPMPFTLKFFEGTWGSISVSSNGALYVGFPAQNDEFSSAVLLQGHRMIAGAWDDLRTDRRPGDDVYVVKPDDNRIIFRWQAVTYDTPIAPGVTRGENPVNFEIEINSDGTIVTRYGDGNHNLFPVVGLGGGWPEAYVVDTHTSPEVLKDLTNAGTVTFTLRNPQPLPSANLSLGLTNGPNPVSNGATETYNVRVFNNGPYSAPNTVVTNVLPASLSFVSCTTTQGTCSAPPVGASGTVSVNVGLLNQFAYADITIVARVASASGSTVNNTFSVASTRFDSDLSNNTVTAAILVTELSGFGDVTAITSALGVNFAVTRDGRVWGWGYNDYGVGVLGTGDTNAGAVSGPVPVQNASNAVAVSTGSQHTLALKSDGTVIAWGANGFGQGPGGSAPYPTLATAVSGLNNVTAVAAGYAHSMALRNDGTVWVWGGNELGQLGIGSADANRHPTPVQVPGLTDVTAIAAGYTYSVAVKSDGSVWTWGNNQNGQLGDTVATRNSPGQVAGVSGVKAVSAGYNHMLALKTDGSVLGWGANPWGQTGSTTLGNVNPTPTPISNLTGVVAVAAGHLFSLALKSDGTVWAWGLNGGGQFGTGAASSGAHTNPTQTSDVANATAVSAGNEHGMALLADGSLRTWGGNDRGQLGDGTLFRRLSPVPVNGVAIVAAPTISPAGATGPAPIVVTVSCPTPGVELRYTTDSLDPNGTSALIPSGGTLNITQNTLLKVRAYKPGSVPSGIITALFTVSAANPIDNTQPFVTQHYQDFLNRAPDAAGLQFWMNNINSCGVNLACREAKRIDTSAAYFLSVEFQQTGYLVHRFFKASFARRPLFTEFLADTQAIGNGVVVNAPGWEQLLSQNKRAFAESWVTRSSFIIVYGGLSDAQYVDTLISNTGASFTQAERDMLVNGLSTQVTTRAKVLGVIAEHPAFFNSEYNAAFVEMQYFGYLRRNPEDAPDNNLEGYNFWLKKLNDFGGDYRKAEMVKAFLTSTEYRQRFGTP